MLSSNDVDRQVSQVAQHTWNMALQSFEIPGHSQGEAREYEEHARREFIQRLESFLLHVIMHPQSLYAEFYPSSATGPTEPTTDAPERVRTGESEEERPGDRDGRLRIAALAALKAHIGLSVSYALLILSPLTFTGPPFLKNPAILPSHKLPMKTRRPNMGSRSYSEIPNFGLSYIRENYLRTWETTTLRMDSRLLG
jgi:hypothetical protein